ncbi:MAG TPA: YraN family protein [Acidimicrobiales bacterium]|nr:YraN family protein [Acidimicrobiales bacterium]
MTSARRQLGAHGEDRVAAWYEAHGYSVADRNWRCRQGELDLVARRRGVVVFCEVKTRSSTAFGAPVEAVTRTKQARLRVLAARWLEDSPVAAREIRFDVASVLEGKVEVLEGAF